MSGHYRFFSWLWSLWGWVCGVGIQVSWELRLLAKNHGVKMCIGITKAKENVLFSKHRKECHILCHDTCTHILIWQKTICCFKLQQRYKWTCYKHFFAPTALLLTPHAANGTFLPCWDYMLKIYPSHGPQTLLTDCMWPRVHGQVHSVCNRTNTWGGRWGVRVSGIFFVPRIRNFTRLHYCIKMQGFSVG